MTARWSGDPTNPIDFFGGDHRTHASFPEIEAYKVTASFSTPDGTAYTLRRLFPSSSGGVLDEDAVTVDVVGYPVAGGASVGDFVWAKKRCVGALGDIYEFLPGTALNTQRVGGTQIDDDTRSIRTDESTFLLTTQVPAAGATPEYARHHINVAGLSNGLVMDKSLRPLTGVCVEVILDKTYSTVPGEEHLMTDVSATVHTYAKGQTISLLSGTTVGAVGCFVDEACCAPTPGPFTGCDRQFPAQFFVTFSGATGTCGCFTGTMTLDWDPFTAGGQYRGDFLGCTGVVTVTITPDSFTTPTNWNVTFAGASYTFDSGTVSQFVPFECEPLAFSLTQTVTAGSCVGDFTFTGSE